MALTGTQSTVVALAIASRQSMSRGSFIGATAWGRWRMTQYSGLLTASSSATSISGLYSMTRLTSIPHDADTSTLGLASSIRSASSCPAKPPKTTEWMAPILAQASIANTASGIIGM